MSEPTDAATTPDEAASAAEPTPAEADQETAAEAPAKLLEELGERARLLAQVQRALKKPGMISLAQRMDLGRQCARAASGVAEAQANLTALAEDAATEDRKAVLSTAREALAAADEALKKSGGGSAQSGRKSAGGTPQKLGGADRTRGAAGAGGSNIKAAGRGE